MAAGTKFWKTPSFREIEKEWYERLKRRGFRDLQPVDGGMMSGEFGGAPPHHKTIMTQYDIAALAMSDADSATYFTRREKAILRRYARGESGRQIAAAMRIYTHTPHATIKKARAFLARS